MKNDMTKQQIIENAILTSRCVMFDYVSKDRSISYNRIARPKSIQEVGKAKSLKMYAKDKNKELVRCFDLEGVMNPRVVLCPVELKGDL